MSPVFWLSVLAAIAVLTLAAEVGFRIARRTNTEEREQLKPSVGIVVGAFLGLLALLLGFTFNMVEERFLQRRQLVVEDANAIGTTYLRASLLPAPHDTRAADLLRSYVALRVTAPTRESAPHMFAQADELQRELWAEARAITAIDPHSQVTSLFVSAVNAMIDAHGARIAVGMHHHLPMPIRIVLYLASTLAFGVVGYAAGLTRKRAAVAVLPLVVAVATVMSFIVEVNRPFAPALRVELDPYKDLQQQMQRDAPATGAALR